jgi:hypothetical protein
MVVRCTRACFDPNSVSEVFGFSLLRRLLEL